jgi:hypothetical protein
MLLDETSRRVLTSAQQAQIAQIVLLNEAGPLDTETERSIAASSPPRKTVDPGGALECAAMNGGME